MDWIAIVWSGFVATTLAMAFHWLARSLGWTSLAPPVQVGCLFLADSRRPATETIGLLILFVTGSTLLPALFRTVLAATGLDRWPGGLILGAVTGLATAAAMTFYGTISACVRSGSLPPPGPFAVGWGRPTPGVIVAGHLIYGTVFAEVLASF